MHDLYEGDVCARLSEIPGMVEGGGGVSNPRWNPEAVVSGGLGGGRRVVSG